MSLKVAIVGLGDIAQDHFKIWRRMNTATVAAVCDSNEQRARETAEAWSIPAYYRDLNEALAEQDISVVDICTPPQTHCPILLTAFEAGCHSIVEKPLAMTADEANTIAEHHGRAQSKVSVIHNWLFVPVMRRVMRRLNEGQMGRVIGVQISMPATQDDTMLANEKHWCHTLPGQRFGELLAHPIYVVQAILGQVAVKSVHVKKLGSYPWVRFDELRINFDADDGTASLYASFNCTRDDALIDIYCTKGILKISLDSDTLVQQGYRPRTVLSKGVDTMRQMQQIGASTAQGAVAKLSRRWIGGTEYCIRAFVDSVLKNTEPAVTLQQACETVQLLDRTCRELDTQPQDG